MAKVRVGINGFGRIGRVLFRAAHERLDVVGINDPSPVATLAHLLKYDSSHGIFSAQVEAGEQELIINGKKIPVSKSKDPTQIPWKAWGVDVVLECTGAFKTREDFQRHIEGGAKRVLVSAPAKADLTVVYGVNHESYDPGKHQVISNASCTTNCLAPVAATLHREFGIEHGTMTTVHSYTNDQRILDAGHSDLRRARAAAVSMIPTTTGAAKAVGEVLPALKGKIDGIAVRVPTPNVSVVDFNFVAQKDLSVEGINRALRTAAEGSLRGVLAYETQPLVSIDFNGNTHSSIVDSGCTMVVGPRLGKVFSWYDNETGFSWRMVDMVEYMAKRGL